MYRDDACAVCGESLPPDHFYCRDHAAGVDDRLHRLSAALTRWLDDLDRIVTLLGQVAPETWDYLAEGEADDPLWPPAPAVELRAEPEEVTIDVDSEPGLVRVRLGVGLITLLAALAEATGELRTMAAACEKAEGANATH
ncbi:MAG: hypothetical protein ACRDYX_08035 [Egibacteraceae bacterium]